MLKYVILFALVLSHTVFAQVDQRIGKQWAYYGQEFYNSKTFSKVQLFNILSAKHSSSKGKLDTIGSCNGNCYSHTSVGYDGARKILFGEIQILRDAQGTYVLDVYCGKKFHFRDVTEASNMHTEVNIEHTWPQSKFSSRFDKGTQKSDMHHLYLTDSDANNKRGNHKFGDLKGSNDELNVQNCDISSLGRGGKDMIFMPPTSHRGNVARSLFYFSVRYDLEISADEEAVLREWHKNDPVDASEVVRHEQVSAHQKIRNPFVDHPEIVNSISNF